MRCAAKVFFMKINKHILESTHFKVQALSFIPKTTVPLRAVFTHGYTSSKNDILSWAVRLSSAGIPTIIFDQPGHYLGSFEEISSFDDFTTNFFKLFKLADETLKDLLLEPSKNLILGGHSLGALSALKALDLNYFDDLNTLSILVGFGLPVEGKTHLFQTKLYAETLELRSGLVSKHIPPDKVFPWIKEQKKELKTFNQKIILINGEDDLVVGKEGSTEIYELLTKLGNKVILKEPKKLAHHQPSLAASNIMAAIKSEFKDYFS